MDKRLSESLRAVYENNKEMVEEAIKKRMYDREELVLKGFLEE